MDPSGIISICVVAAMIIAGVLGSYAKYLITLGRIDVDKDSRIWGKSGGNIPFFHIILPGVAASFVVPLFLSIGKSTLLGDIFGNKDIPENILVLFAFCVIAAYSSHDFLSSLARQILKAAEEAKEDRNRAEEAADTAEDLLAESDAPPPEKLTADAKFVANLTAKYGLTDDQTTVLQALQFGNYGARSVTGLAQDANLDKNLVRSALQQLIRLGLVNEYQSTRTKKNLYQPVLSKLSEKTN